MYFSCYVDSIVMAFKFCVLITHNVGQILWGVDRVIHGWVRSVSSSCVLLMAAPLAKKDRRNKERVMKYLMINCYSIFHSTVEGTRTIFQQCISVPSSSNLTYDDQLKVISEIKNFYK